jgi:hypothetical protein
MIMSADKQLNPLNISPTASDRGRSIQVFLFFKKQNSCMKKISLNKETLNQKKFNLIKEKITSLTDPESSKVTGGSYWTQTIWYSYVTYVQQCPCSRVNSPCV